MHLLPTALLLIVLVCGLEAYKRTLPNDHVRKAHRTTYPVRRVYYHPVHETQANPPTLMKATTEGSTRRPSHNKMVPVCVNGNLAHRQKRARSCSCKENTIQCAYKQLGSANIYPSGPFKTMVVETVDLKHNSIDALTTGHLMPRHEAKVKTLNLSNNLISYMEPGCFDKFGRLQVLNLDHNRITELAKGVFSYHLGYHLERLHLANNKIVRPKGAPFKELSSLKYLTLDDNLLEEITAETFKGLGDLEHLSLENTGLTHIGEGSLYELKRLKSLSLRRNHFLQVPSLHGLSSLTNLDLSETHITEVKSLSFSSLKHLEQLTIEQNPFLWGIEDCAFCGLNKLKKISLKNSRALMVIDFDAFGQKNYFPIEHRLELFDLSNCNLTTLDKDLVPWHQVDTIKLAGNPWRCDCDISWMVRHNHFTDNVIVDHPRCGSPREVMGHLMSHERHGVLSTDVCSIFPSHYKHHKMRRSIVFTGALLLLGSVAIATLWCMLARRKRTTGYKRAEVFDDKTTWPFAFHDHLDQQHKNENEKNTVQPVSI